MLQNTDTIHYYDRTDYERRLAEAENPVLRGSRISSWLRGETVQQYEARLRSSGEKVIPHKIYMEQERVRRETVHRLDHHARVTYSKLHDAMPVPVRTLMKVGQTDSKTLTNMPHLGYVELFQMNALYPDGSVSRLRFMSANFEATVIPGENGLTFKSIPRQRDGVKNRDTFFVYGRRVNADGTIGDLDPHFSKEGIAYRPSDLSGVAHALFRVGKLTILTQRHVARGGTLPIETAKMEEMNRKNGKQKDNSAYDPLDMVISLDEASGLPAFR